MNRRWLLVCLAVLAALSLAFTTGCTKGPRVRGGNLKEKREKKRALMEAQRVALEEERQRELAAEAEAKTPPPSEPTPADPEAPPVTPGPEAPPVQPEPGVVQAEPAKEAATTAEAKPPVRDAPEARVPPPRPEPDYAGDRCRITVRRPDGSEFTKLLYQPLVGYMERTYRTNGGVVDSEHATPMFRFQVGLSLHKVKFRNIDRVEVLEEPDSRTGVLYRFHFRKGRKPSDFPAEQLVGAGHPKIPFLQGMGTDGLERFPLFRVGDQPDYLAIVEMDFTP
jgi:hypothetical protein